MKSFRLHEPATVAEAVDALHRLGASAQPLAGGTDLVAGVMRDLVVGSGMPYPEHLLDVTTIDGMTGVTVAADGVTIGAATTLVDIVESAEIRRRWPLLADAAGNVASPEIRAVGTLGGNIHQRPRCWFFRGKHFDCLKKGGDVCFAVDGDNRFNAIVGGTMCYIVHPSDTAAALVALDARARVVGPRGERVIAFDRYFVGPAENLLKETVLERDELLVDVFVPTPAPSTRMAWRKLNEKPVSQTWDFALVSVALSAVVEGGVWRGGRIVLGGVAPVPYRASVVEAALEGRTVREAARQAAQAFRGVARPMRDNGYKVELTETLVEQALLAVAE